MLFDFQRISAIKHSYGVYDNVGSAVMVCVYCDISNKHHAYCNLILSLRGIRNICDGLTYPMLIILLVRPMISLHITYELLLCFCMLRSETSA